MTAARYSNEFRERAVARRLPPESAEISRVSQEIGVSVATLERWRADALSRPARERALDSASARHRSNVATDTPISWDTRETSALSGGSNRATARSLNSLLYRDTVVPQCPQGYRGIETTTTVTWRGDLGEQLRVRPPAGSGKLIYAPRLAEVNLLPIAETGMRREKPPQAAVKGWARPSLWLRCA